MLHICLFFVVFFHVTYAKSVPYRFDGSFEDQIELFITRVNQYTKHRSLNVVKLPSLNLITFKMANGQISDFSTWHLEGKPFLNKTETTDGFTIQYFKVNLSLQKLVFQYDLILNLFLFSKTGNFSISVGKNSVEMIGQVTFVPQGFCRAAILDIRFLEYEDFKLKIYPYELSLINWLTEAIMNLNSRMLLPIANKILFLESIMSSSFTNFFSHTICKTFPR